MKKVISILLSLLIISQMMVDVGICVYFHFNKEYIANQLCVNKGIPSLHCNGQCYLSKKLKDAESHEKQSSQCFKEKDEIFSTVISPLSIPYFPAYMISRFIAYAPLSPDDDSFDTIIKPPA